MFIIIVVLGSITGNILGKTCIGKDFLLRLPIGMYNNAREVIHDALRRLDIKEKFVYALKLNRMKEALAPGIEEARNSEFIDQSFDEIIAEAKQEVRGA